MNKAYSRINWENYPSTDTPINETNLNHMDLAVDTIDDRVITLDTTKADEADLLTCVASISFNSTTGIMTITLKNGTQGTIDTGLSKLAINFDYDDDPTSPHYQQIILEMKDGTYKYIDLSALITQYEFTNSSTIAWTIGNDGTVSASVVDGSITADKLQPNYLADIILQVGKAQTAATNANADALVSEGWAKGTQNGVPVSSGSPYYENNAEYFKDQAQLIAGQTLGGLTDVTLTSPSDGQVLTYDSNSDEWVNKDIATDLADLGDVNLTTPTDGQALIYDGGSQKWVNKDVTHIVNVPVPKTKNYTYNGTSQTFEWNSIDNDNIILSGNTQTNAGSYTVTATLKGSADRWDDMTTAPKTFSWNIAKANQTFDLSANSVSLTSANPTAAVNISNATGDGAFSVSSSNTGVATASVNGDVVSITGVENGSATITVTKAATTNYNALSKTITASVNVNISITFSIKSAANDAITIDGPLHTGASAITATTDGNGSGTVTMTIPSNGGSYSFTSSRAKDLDNSGNDYSKTISLTAQTTIVYVMPNNTYYWIAYLQNEWASPTVNSGEPYGTGTPYKNLDYYYPVSTLYTREKTADGLVLNAWNNGTKLYDQYELTATLSFYRLIDVTNINTIKLLADKATTKIRMSLRSITPSGVKADEQYEVTALTANADDKQLSLDVSNLTGTHYLNVAMSTWGTVAADNRITQIWGE